MVVEPTGGLIGWVQQYGNIIFFFGQILFWIAVAVPAVWAAMNYKRYVDFITGTVKVEDAAEAPADEAAVAVDEFVE